MITMVAGRSVPLISQHLRHIAIFCLCPAFAVAIARAETERSTPDHRTLAAVGELIGEDVLTLNAREICRRTASLSDVDRFTQLADWVFPSTTHRTLRLQAAFQPANLASRIHASSEQRKESQSPFDHNLASPVFDLLDVAAKLNRLPELRERLSAVRAPSTNEQRRAVMALSILIAMQTDGESPAIDQGVAALSELIKTSTATNLQAFWPETLVVALGMQLCPRHPAIGDLLMLITSERTERGFPQGHPEWHGLIWSLSQQHSYGLTHPDQTASELSSTAALKQWRSNPRQRGYSRSTGFPQSLWNRDGSQISHVGGHEEDYLLYQSPLLGDFAIDFETPAEGQAQVLAGGNSFGPQWIDHIIYGDLRRGAQPGPLAPPLNHLDAWVHCRVEFRGDVRSMFINGRCVRTDSTSRSRDPWIGIHSWSRGRGGIRDVRITGQPIIPDSISLVFQSDLPGWHSYQEDSVGFAEAAWRFEPSENIATDGNNGTAAGQIIGRHFSWIPGTDCERLLRYHRPLIEDGAVEYEFFYEPGRAMSYPALDRMAFIIDSQQVMIHRITDDRHEQDDLSPDNVLSANVPSNKDAAQAPADSTGLPLIENAWNRLRVAVAGQTAFLELNGQQIHQRIMEPENSRHFGVFYFADRGEARVRNLVMTGHWPKSLPPLKDQELADRTVTTIDSTTAELGPVFHHDFSAGLPEQYFLIPADNRGGQILVTPDGLQCMQTSNGPSTSSRVTPLFEVHGDFDVSVGFDSWRTSNSDFCGSSMVVTTATGHRFAVTRRVQSKTRHWAVLEWAIPKGNGEFARHYETLMTEATGGRLRAVRLGDDWHALFADSDTSIYRLIGSVNMPGSATEPASLEMFSVSGESGTTQFTWKDLRIATDELMTLPDARTTQKVSVFVMNADGSNLRRVSVPGADDPGHGSPDWSPDGKQILYDSWRGSANASRIFLVNSDGTNSHEVGSGSMATFAPDGKRIAFSGAQGMSIMNTDGTGLDVISTSGWGAQWSPDGQSIAFGDHQRVDGKTRANIAIANVKTRQVRHVLEGEHAARYAQVIWNMEWSPDSRRICFKAGLASGGEELAITSVAGSNREFQVLTDSPVETDPSWHPDGSRILVAMPSPKHSGVIRLFVYDLAEKSFTYLTGQPSYQNNNSGVWSPNGKQISFISLSEPERVRWKPE
ncbi:MAG: DUF1583 domain-containing protein [Planctomycetaceae bacterium]